MTTSRMRRHLHVGLGHRRNQMCKKNFQNRFRGSGAGKTKPWKWHLPLKAFIALATVLRYRSDCDER